MKSLVYMIAINIFRGNIPTLLFCLQVEHPDRINITTSISVYKDICVSTVSITPTTPPVINPSLSCGLIPFIFVCFWSVWFYLEFLIPSSLRRHTSVLWRYFAMRLPLCRAKLQSINSCTKTYFLPINIGGNYCQPMFLTVRYQFMYLQAFFVRCLDIFSLENDLHELCYSIELNLEFIKGIKIGALSTSHNIVCVLPPPPISY